MATDKTKATAKPATTTRTPAKATGIAKPAAKPATGIAAKATTAPELEKGQA
ncbi:MAG TPA: hypothetical protein VGD24_04995 [Gallionella sp.]